VEQALPGPQSLLTPHVAPQSVSVSLPFLTLSEQVGAWQVTLHTPDTQSLGAVHVLPVPQRTHVVAPPQSMALSPWFFAPSLQVGVVQRLLVLQSVLVQSVPAVQVLPGPQRLQLVAPPQSMSDSAWFLTVSVQLGGAHSPPLHTPLWQSTAPPHVLPVPHLEQEAPPQSMSLSLPFLTLSEHVGVAHVPLVHTPLWQSPALPQSLPLAHFLVGKQPPPQSTSDSVPFLTRSEQVGA
jgi:hypothetical protein